MPKPLSASLPSTVTPTAEGDDESYSFDVSKPNTRWALAEVAKTMQHIANISCLPTEEMFVSFVVMFVDVDCPVHTRSLILP